MYDEEKLQDRKYRKSQNQLRALKTGMSYSKVQGFPEIKYFLEEIQLFMRQVIPAVDFFVNVLLD